MTYFLLVLLFGLAGAMILGLLDGALGTAMISGGAIVGLLLSVVWATRRSHQNVAATVLGAAAVPVALLWLTDPGSGVGVLAVAAVVCWVVSMVFHRLGSERR